MAEERERERERKRERERESEVVVPLASIGMSRRRLACIARQHATKLSRYARAAVVDAHLENKMHELPLHCEFRVRARAHTR